VAAGACKGAGAAGRGGARCGVAVAAPRGAACGSIGGAAGALCSWGRARGTREGRCGVLPARAWSRARRGLGRCRSGAAALRGACSAGAVQGAGEACNVLHGCIMLSSPGFWCGRGSAGAQQPCVAARDSACPCDSAYSTSTPCASLADSTTAGRSGSCSAQPAPSIDSLARRPAHLAAAQDVQVKVVHALRGNSREDGLLGTRQASATALHRRLRGVARFKARAHGHERANPIALPGCRWGRR
jgi:hypothetical protein